MIKFTTLIFPTLLLFCSCGQDSQQGQSSTFSDSTEVDTLAILNDPTSNLNVQTNSIIEIDSSGIILFPLSIGESDRGGSSYYSYKNIPYSTYWNIIFYNSLTSEYHLLSERKMLISRYDIKNNSSDKRDINYTTNNIFYEVIVEDFDLDKKLTPNDPEYLFVSDKEGKNFRQISPPGYNLESWQFIKSTNKIIMAVKKDTDGNKTFGDTDEVSSFQIEIDKETQATEIFSTEFKKILKVLFDKNWKRLEE